MLLITSIFFEVVSAIFFGFGVLGHEFYFDDNGDRDFGIYRKRIGGIPEDVETTSDELDWAQPLALSTWLITLFLLAWDVYSMNGGDRTTEWQRMLTAPKTLLNAVLVVTAWTTFGLMMDHYEHGFSPAKDFYFWVSAAVLMTLNLVPTGLSFCASPEQWKGNDGEGYGKLG